MDLDAHIIFEAQLYGVFSILLIGAMIWMVIKEKQKLDKTNGRRKK